MPLPTNTVVQFKYVSLKVKSAKNLLITPNQKYVTEYGFKILNKIRLVFSRIPYGGESLTIKYICFVIDSSEASSDYVSVFIWYNQNQVSKRTNAIQTIIGNVKTGFDTNFEIEIDVFAHTSFFSKLLAAIQNNLLIFLGETPEDSYDASKATIDDSNFF